MIRIWKPRVRDQSIGLTLSLAFATTLSLMAVLVGLTLYQIQETRHFRGVLSDELNPAIESLKDLRADVQQLGDRLRIALLTGRRDDLDRVSRTAANLDAVLRALAFLPNPGREAVALVDLRQHVDALQSAARELLDRARRFGPTVAASEYPGRFEPRVQPALAAASRLQAPKEARRLHIRTHLALWGDRLWIYLLAGFFVAAGVCLSVARSTLRMITVPARRLVVAARVLEHGDYERAIGLGAEEAAEESEPVNELARMRQSFARMARALQEREDRLRQQARHLEAANCRLAALQSVTDVALTHLDLEELLQQLVERVVQATSAEAGAILLLDEAGLLQARATVGVTPDVAQATFNDSTVQWTAWLCSGAGPLVLPVPDGETPSSTGAARSSRLVSMVVMPLVAGDKPIGLAHVDGARRGQFGDEAVALMAVFAQRVALAIERARAFAALEDWNQILERRLAEQEERLVRTQHLASLGLIGAGIAHELRNPLGVITNAVFFLRQRLHSDDEKLLRHAQIIEREVAHAVRIIDNLVQFSHQGTPHAYPVELHRVTATVRERIELPPSATLDIALSEDLPPIRADEHRLIQVLENLIRNALEAVEEQGRVQLAAERAGDRVVISVSDTGPGIAPEERGRIFEPLVSTKVKGMGLGLALSKKMVEAWGGTIDVDCPPEGGTVFRITLPVAHDARIDPAPAPLAPQGPDWLPLSPEARDGENAKARKSEHARGRPER